MSAAATSADCNVVCIPCLVALVAGDANGAAAAGQHMDQARRRLIAV